MRRLLSVFVLFACLVALTFATVPSAAAAIPTMAQGSVNNPAALNQYEQQVLTILLQARTAEGVAAPQLDPSLNAVARERSADMATRNYFSHYSPEGASVFTALNAHGVQWAFAGEIISRNNYSADQTATVAGNAFLASTAHRAVAVDPQYNAVGVGHAVDANGMHYYTVIFVRR